MCALSAPARKQDASYVAYAPEFGVCSYRACHEEVLNSLQDELRAAQTRNALLQPVVMAAKPFTQFFSSPMLSQPAQSAGRRSGILPATVRDNPRLGRYPKTDPSK